jgi:hypothetical protein
VSILRTDEQRDTNLDKVRMALENYVEDTYGSGGGVKSDWVAVLSTIGKAS